MLTTRLLLRPLRLADAPALAAYRSDPDTARFQPWLTPYTVGDAETLITELVTKDPGTPGWFQYGIELRSDGTLIGDLGVNLDANGMQADIGYTIATGQQGNGYGTEAVRRILDHLFGEQQLHRVAAECDARNVASARLLERVGFTPEGRRRSASWIKGEWIDDLLFGLLADEWPARPPLSSGQLGHQQ
jgi:aminoglycoside 6'-N-acetyltransferase